MTWFKIDLRIVRIALLSVASLPSVGAAPADNEIRLGLEFFQKIAPMGMNSNPEAYPQWQEVSVGFEDKAPVKILFPARTLVERITAPRPSAKGRAPAISFDQIEIGLFRSTSYFSVIYNVRVTLKESNGKEHFFIAGFRGKRNRNYLRTIEAQRQICDAIVECVKGVERTGGFQP